MTYRTFGTMEDREIVAAGQKIELSRRVAFTSYHPAAAIADEAWVWLHAVGFGPRLIASYTGITPAESVYSTRFLIPEARYQVDSHNLDPCRWGCLLCSQGGENYLRAQFGKATR